MKGLGVLVLGLMMTVSGGAEVLEVGVEKQFGRIEAALEAAQPGDSIAVYPKKGGGFYRKVALHVRKPRIMIKAVGAAMKEEWLGGMRVGVEYRDPQKVVRREWRGKPDLGAFEWGE